MRLGDLFTVRRGIATGANDFFVLPRVRADQLGLPRRFLRPILPSPRFVRVQEVEADADGHPRIDAPRVLLACRLPENVVAARHPDLWAYLESGRQRGIPDRYLCRHRRPWYAQEEREPAPILCTYMGRAPQGQKAFRFILNHSEAIAANVYLLLYPKPGLARRLDAEPGTLRALWAAMNDLPWSALLGSGRVYGGGLHKIEPKELADAPVDQLAELVPADVPPRPKQLTLDL